MEVPWHSQYQYRKLEKGKKQELENLWLMELIELIAVLAPSRPFSTYGSGAQTNTRGPCRPQPQLLLNSGKDDALIVPQQHRGS